jgi:hypothetical protein
MVRVRGTYTEDVYGTMEPSQATQAVQTWTAEHSLWAAVITLAVEDATMPHGWLKGGGGCPRCSAWDWLASEGFAEVASVLMLTVEGEALNPVAVLNALQRRYGGAGPHPFDAGQTFRMHRSSTRRSRQRTRPQQPQGPRLTDQATG